MPDQLELFPPVYNSLLTISEAFEILWKAHLSYKASGRTYMANRKAWCKSIGHRHLHTINEIDIIKHKEERLNAGKGLGTVFHDHGLITLLFSKFYAWKRKGIAVEGIDMRMIELPREHPTIGIVRKKSPPRTTVITPNEFSRLIEHATDRLRDIIYFAIDTGIRQGDLLKLKVGNYNLTTNQIEFVQRKTGKWLSIPVTSRVQKIITDAAKSGMTYILDAVNFDGDWRKAKKRAGLRHIQFRDIRRTGASEAYRVCKDPRKVRDLLGHASERTTMDVYVVTKKEDLRPVVKHLEKVFR